MVASNAGTKKVLSIPYLNVSFVLRYSANSVRSLVDCLRIFFEDQPLIDFPRAWVHVQNDAARANFASSILVKS